MFQAVVFRCTKCEQLLDSKSLDGLKQLEDLKLEGPQLESLKRFEPDGEPHRLACPFCALVSRLERFQAQLANQAHRTYCLRNGIERVNDMLLDTGIDSTPDERAEVILAVCQFLKLLLVEDSKAAKDDSP